MQKYRRKAIYELFVHQFLAAGQKCLAFENHKYVAIYVRQARRLADLLREDHFEIDAHELHELISKLEVLQKHPEVKRSQSNVRSQPRRDQRSPKLQKFEVWQPPLSPDGETRCSPMSPVEMGEGRKSILKNCDLRRSSPKLSRVALSQPRKNDTRNGAVIKVDIHHDTKITVRAPPSPVFRSRSTTITLTNSNDNVSDYPNNHAIELVNRKEGADQEKHLRFTSQLVDNGQEINVSIL